MSIALIESPKHCAIKERTLLHKRHKKLFLFFSSVFTSLLFLVVIIWLILHPSKPEFSLKEANIYQLYLSSPNLLNSSIQLTLLSKNPNERVGIYYDELQAYVAYKGQQITVDSSFPPFYQGHQDTNLLTASLVGNRLPVASSFGYRIGRDLVAGKIVMNLKVNGRLRWKVGTWVSGRYRINVNCVAVFGFGSSGQLGSNMAAQCSTNV